eukprot:Amastigsp_a511471_7.p4 type:complete len:109 gc:universal Amastigsp_a511471_7:1388-1062(-)
MLLRSSTTMSGRPSPDVSRHATEKRSGPSKNSDAANGMATSAQALPVQSETRRPGLPDLARSTTSLNELPSRSHTAAPKKFPKAAPTDPAATNVEPSKRRTATEDPVP